MVFISVDTHPPPELPRLRKLHPDPREKWHNNKMSPKVAHPNPSGNPVKPERATDAFNDPQEQDTSHLATLSTSLPPPRCAVRGKLMPGALCFGAVVIGGVFFLLLLLLSLRLFFLFLVHSPNHLPDHPPTAEKLMEKNGSLGERLQRWGIYTD